MVWGLGVQGSGFRGLGSWGLHSSLLGFRICLRSWEHRDYKVLFKPLENFCRASCTLQVQS